MSPFDLVNHTFEALDRREPRNLRRYPSVPAADDPCEECDGTGEVERNIDGCDVMVVCGHCAPPMRATANAWQDRDADDAGVPMYGEL
jgi:hypothetical protein